MFPKASTRLMSADEAATFSAFDTSHQAAIGNLVAGIALLIWAGGGSVSRIRAIGSGRCSPW